MRKTGTVRHIDLQTDRQTETASQTNRDRDTDRQRGRGGEREIVYNYVLNYNIFNSFRIDSPSILASYLS